MKTNSFGETFLAALFAILILLGSISLIAWALSALIPALVADPASFWLWALLLLLSVTVTGSRNTIKAIGKSR